MREGKRAPTVVGGISLLVIFAVLCLTVFAVLSLAQGQADRRPAQLLCEPWCRECARQGRRVRATDVDHIEPHNGDWERFTDPSNLQSLCHSCHSAKTMAESRAKGKTKRR